MIDISNQVDWLLLARLITAHLIAEWLFQLSLFKTGKTDKKCFSKQNLIQGAAAGFIGYLVAGSWNSPWLILVLSICRVGISCWECKNKKISENLFFVLKHLCYLLVFIGCWIGLGYMSLKDVGENLTSLTSNGRLWIVGLAYIILTWPVSFLIAKFTEPWRKELQQVSNDKINREGLTKAGLFLGRLERILILTFILLNKFEAIGFLITAKSIFRYSEIKSSKDRKEAEYMLIGTMLSFVIALILGIFANWLLQQVQY